MALQVNTESSGATSAEFERVLRAEREAKEAIANCQRDAAEMVDQARERARRISLRTDQRLSSLQQRYSARTVAEIETLSSSAEDENRQRAAQLDDQPRLELAITRLAALLTGGSIERPK